MYKHTLLKEPKSLIWNISDLTVSRCKKLVRINSVIILPQIFLSIKFQPVQDVKRFLFDFCFVLFRKNLSPFLTNQRPKYTKQSKYTSVNYSHCSIFPVRKHFFFLIHFALYTQISKNLPII